MERIYENKRLGHKAVYRGILNMKIATGDYPLKLRAREKRCYESWVVLLVDRELQEVICFKDKKFKGLI